MSYQWRNNPKIWRHTCSKPDRHITVEMESESLARILTREDEKRFAICLATTVHISETFSILTSEMAKLSCTFYRRTKALRKG